MAPFPYRLKLVLLRERNGKRFYYASYSYFKNDPLISTIFLWAVRLIKSNVNSKQDHINKPNIKRSLKISTVLLYRRFRKADNLGVKNVEAPSKCPAKMPYYILIQRQQQI
jgi:hypothetical protein